MRSALTALPGPSPCTWLSRGWPSNRGRTGEGGAVAVGADLSRVVLGGDFNSQPAALSADLLVSFFAAGGRMVETARSYSDGHGEAVGSAPGLVDS
jgi:hypothetical protein